MPNLLNRRLLFGGVPVPAYIAAAPNIPKPIRKATVVQIPGTSREVVQMEDAWETYDQVYTLFVGDGSQDSIQQAIDDVSKVLYKSGWQTLEDDYDPSYFRLAYFLGGFETDNKKTRVGLFDVTFKCRAEKFLASGNNRINVATGSSVNNPTNFIAKPLIYVEGLGSGTLVVGGTTVNLTGLADYIYIDCDKMDVYRLPAENRNSLMTGNFPVLNPGNNIVTFTGGITSVKITPRYFVI